MARIRDMAGNPGTSYALLFGSAQLGFIFSQAHAASIRAGTELQRFIDGHIDPQMITTIRAITSGKHSCLKEVVLSPTKPRAGETQGIVADYAVFDHQRRYCQVIELKTGENYDTQKSPAIKASLQYIAQYLSTITGYTSAFYVCSFFADSRGDIVAGLKQVFTGDQVMTGPELCQLLGLDYRAIRQFQAEDQRDNCRYLSDLLTLAQAGPDDTQFFATVEEHRTGQLNLFMER